MRHMKQMSGIRTIRNFFLNNILLLPVMICMNQLHNRKNFYFFFLGLHRMKLILGDYRILNLHLFHCLDFLYVMQLSANSI